MSDQENMQISNIFPSALKKNRRRYTIANKVSTLEKLRSKTLSEIVKDVRNVSLKVSFICKMLACVDECENIQQNS